MDQYNRIDHPEISPQSCGQLIFDKGTRIHNVKKKSLQQMVLGKLCRCMQTNEVRALLHILHKNKLKMTQVSCIAGRCFTFWATREAPKHKTWHHKTPEEITGKTFSDINHTSVFLGQSPKAIEITTKINKWDLIKLTSFRTAKESINKMRRPLSENGRKYLQMI